MFKQIIDGVDMGAGQILTLVLGLGICGFGQPASYSHPHHQVELSSIAQLIYPCNDE